MELHTCLVISKKCDFINCLIIGEKPVFDCKDDNPDCHSKYGKTVKNLFANTIWLHINFT